MSMKFRAILAIFIIAVAAIAYAATRHDAPTAGAVKLSFIGAVSYSCDMGKSVTASYYESAQKVATKPGEKPVPEGKVDLTLSDGRTLSLDQTISADGMRYANPDESFVFWSKGNGALVLEHNTQKTYIGCVRIAQAPDDPSLSRIYSSGSKGFSILLPSGATPDASYTVDDAYRYRDLGPNKTIGGVRFTIPRSLATGTNLSSDTYISVEEIPKSPQCSAALFVAPGSKAISLDDGVTTYSVATSSGAAAGNRYEETVFALPGTNPCMAVRYFVHYGAIENYPTGVVERFDRAGLLARFDAVRRTLVVNQ